MGPVGVNKENIHSLKEECGLCDGKRFAAKAKSEIRRKRKVEKKKERKVKEGKRERASVEEGGR